MSLQPITILNTNYARTKVDSSEQEEAAKKRYFLVRDETRVMLLHFRKLESQEIGIVPFIDSDVLHQTIFAENQTLGGPPQVKIWAAQHSVKKKLSFKTRRKIYEFTMPYFIQGKGNNNVGNLEEKNGLV
jgi:hypothetical protein